MSKWYHQFQDLLFKYYFVKYCSELLYVSAVFGIECHSTPNRNLFFPCSVISEDSNVE